MDNQKINKKINRRHHIRNILIPCLLKSGLCGIFTGAWIFLFKTLASHVIEFSFSAYDYVRENTKMIPLFLLAAAFVGIFSYLIIKNFPSCRGGGIPTAVTFIRGFLSFKWVSSVFALFTSSLFTFLGGIPLGNEGPSVQMGCAIGRGTVNLFSKGNKSWDKYIMTSGACAGFAAATGAPISAMLFSIEEIHHRFSPLLFMATSNAVLASSVTMSVLGNFFNKDTALFHLTIDFILPMRFIWATIAVGAVAGIVAICFTKLYSLFDKIINMAMKKVPLYVKVVSIFVIVAVWGIFSEGFIGSGHDIVHDILSGHNAAWYVLLLYLLVRAVLLFVSNQTGISGGLFVPSLAFGAIVGGVFADMLIKIGIYPAEYKIILVIVGMVAFLASVSRIPITATIFAAEALSGLTNIVPIAVGVAFSYLVIEAVGVTAFADNIIERKIEESHKGKKIYVADARLVVCPNSFAVGKEIRDILWPPTCVISSVYRNDPHSSILGVGDSLHLKYKTTNKEATLSVLKSLLGEEQDPEKIIYTRKNDEHYNIPEN